MNMRYFYCDGSDNGWSTIYVIVECSDTSNIDINSWPEVDYVYDKLQAKEMCDKHNRELLMQQIRRLGPLI